MKKICQRGRVLVLFSSLALTTIVPVPKAHAVIGLITSFVPLMILGAAMEMTGLIGIVGSWFSDNWQDRPFLIWWESMALIGWNILDDKNSTATLQQLSVQKAQEYGITPSQYVAYNEAVRNGEMDAVLQTACQEFAELKDQNLSAAGSIMNNLLTALDPNARDAFYKIATSLLVKASS